MIKESNVNVIRGENLDLKNGVKKNGEKIISIKMESGLVFKAKVFIDCTYEGDLMAKSGVDYTVGRESNSEYGEKLNGVQNKEPGRIGKRPLDPFIIPGDSTSGLIDGLQPRCIGKQGEGDKMVQAYNYRLCLTNVPENRVPFDKPKGYNKKEYELLFRWLEAGNTKGLPFGTSPMPNKKTDTNKAGWVSTDYIGKVDSYPDADYVEREKIINAHICYTKGFLWTLANDPRVPKSIRERTSEWGYAKDEFKDNGNFPYQLYVREARRMKGEMIMTENELHRRPAVTDPIALGSYGIDAHPTQLWVDKKGVLHADTPKWTGVGIYGISYRAITPKASQCTNLLVPVCLSATHSALGSMRMEPVYMMLGQSAGAAAALSVKNHCTVQNLSYDKLKKQLIESGQILYKKDIRK